MQFPRPLAVTHVFSTIDHSIVPIKEWLKSNELMEEDQPGWAIEVVRHLQYNGFACFDAGNGGFELAVSVPTPPLQTIEEIMEERQGAKRPMPRPSRAASNTVSSSPRNKARG